MRYIYKYRISESSPKASPKKLFSQRSLQLKFKSEFYVSNRNNLDWRRSNDCHIDLIIMLHLSKNVFRKFFPYNYFWKFAPIQLQFGSQVSRRMKVVTILGAPNVCTLKAISFETVMFSCRSNESNIDCHYQINLTCGGSSGISLTKFKLNIVISTP